MVEGSVFDGEAVRRTVAGADVVLSALGARCLKREDVLERAVPVIVEAMKVEGVRRIVVLGSAGALEDSLKKQAAWRRWFVQKVVYNTVLKWAVASQLAQWKMLSGEWVGLYDGDAADVDGWERAGVGTAAGGWRGAATGCAADCAGGCGGFYGGAGGREGVGGKRGVCGVGPSYRSRHGGRAWLVVAADPPKRSLDPPPRTSSPGTPVDGAPGLEGALGWLWRTRPSGAWIHPERTSSPGTPVDGALGLDGALGVDGATGCVG